MKKLITVFSFLICLLFCAKSLFAQTLTPPEFPGGEEAFHKYLYKNINWPADNAKQGTVVISFFVEKNGRLSGFKVEKSVSPTFDAEVLKVIKASPNWIPALRDHKPIKSKYTAPVKYFVRDLN